MVFYPIMLLFFCIIVLVLLFFLMLVFTVICVLKRRWALHEFNPNKETAGLFKKMLTDSSLHLKKCLIGFSCLLLFTILFFFWIVGNLRNANSQISGFAGTIGIIRLELSRNDYIEIGNDPRLVLVRTDRFFDVQFVRNEFFDLYFDEHIGYGVGIRNGIKYRIGLALEGGALTRRYALIRVSPVP